MRGNITIVLIAVYNRTHWAILRCPGVNAPCTLHRAPPAARKAVAGRLAAPTVHKACGPTASTPDADYCAVVGLVLVARTQSSSAGKKVQRLRCVAVGLGILFLYNRMI